MAIGTTFGTLISRLRAETGRSSLPSLGVSEDDKIKNAINHVYELLATGHNWPHLRKVFERIELEAGDSYYNLPDGLDYERIEAVTAWSGTVRWSLRRGIGFEQYESYSRVDDERSSPPQRWDLRWTGSMAQMEIWPIPASTDEYEVEIIGFQSCPRLVADADVCRLDDNVIVLFAAAEMLSDEAAEKKLKLAQDRLHSLLGRATTGAGPFRMGLGEPDNGVHPVVLRVGR